MKSASGFNELRGYLLDTGIVLKPGSPEYNTLRPSFSRLPGQLIGRSLEYADIPLDPVDRPISYTLALEIAAASKRRRIAGSLAITASTDPRIPCKEQDTSDMHFYIRPGYTTLEGALPRLTKLSNPPAILPLVNGMLGQVDVTLHEACAERFAYGLLGLLIGQDVNPKEIRLPDTEAWKQ